MADQSALELARRLMEARASGVPVPRVLNLSAEMARETRRHCISMLTQERLLPLRAYKVSLSTGTWGALPDDSVFVGNATLSRLSLMDPLLEGELAFLVEADLEAGCTISDILELCSVAPAIEIADSRWEHWRPSDWDRFEIPTAAEIEADNAMGGALVIGQPWIPARDLDPAALNVEMRSGGKTLVSAPFSDVMGNPAEAVRWLVEAVADERGPVRKGQIISAGCPHHTPVTVSRAGSWEAVVDGLGVARVSFE